MFRAFDESRRRDGGFSIVELVVVVAIIAILIGIGIPTFFGARTRSQDRAAETDLKQAHLTARSYHTEKESFAAGTLQLTADAYNVSEPSLNFQPGPAAASLHVIYIAVATSTSVMLVTKSASGKWVCVADSSTGAASFGISSAAANPFLALADCTSGW